MNVRYTLAVGEQHQRMARQGVAQEVARRSKVAMKCRASSDITPPRVRGQFEMPSRKALS